jgi:hypothetical protein
MGCEGGVPWGVRVGSHGAYVVARVASAKDEGPERVPAVGVVAVDANLLRHVEIAVAVPVWGGKGGDEMR